MLHVRRMGWLMSAFAASPPTKRNAFGVNVELLATQAQAYGAKVYQSATVETARLAEYELLPRAHAVDEVSALGLRGGQLRQLVHNVRYCTLNALTFIQTCQSIDII